MQVTTWRTCCCQWGGEFKREFRNFSLSVLYDDLVKFQMTRLYLSLLNAPFRETCAIKFISASE